MRCVSGQRWGPKKSSLLCVYRALIRSLFDYGCIAFASAANSSLKLLDAVQYKALLLVTGGMKGTPLSALLAECGEKTLVSRRNELILKYLVKLDWSVNNPAKEILEDLTFFNLSNKLKSMYAPILKNFYKDNNVQLNWRCNASNQTLNIVSHKVDISLSSSLNGNSFSHHLDCEIDNYLMSKYESFTWIFVDGACNSRGKVGFSIYVPSLSIEISLRTQDNLSVYSAELLAIDNAVNVINKNKLSDCLVVSDSLEVLTDMKNGSSKSSFRINSVLRKVEASPADIRFAWIPSNSISFHAYADRLAKSALAIATILVVPVDMADLLSLVKREADKQWFSEWTNYKSYRSYNQNIPFNAKGFLQKLIPRKKETLIARLRLMCPASNALLFKIGLSDSEFCSTCKVPETTQHILLECVNHIALSNHLHKILSCKKLNINLANILSDCEAQSAIYEYCINNQLKW